ncbi:hypothetical protein T11_3248 [Trichinella zimbabwensis]|uniref:Uncharacterized protein n=1 Tax=Trichinella zimbabwensis TaxID=268475 RepID=A0A0V1I5Y5_9BILA|nr:hypothetical protein T11_3248 [Trichinella zimbabwensis]
MTKILSKDIFINGKMLIGQNIEYHGKVIEFSLAAAFQL